jgi:hypothetical protein
MKNKNIIDLLKKIQILLIEALRLLFIKRRMKSFWFLLIFKMKERMSDEKKERKKERKKEIEKERKNSLKNHIGIRVVRLLGR